MSADSSPPIAATAEQPPTLKASATRRAIDRPSTTTSALSLPIRRLAPPHSTAPSMRPTPDTLAARILEAEHSIYPEALRRVAAGEAVIDGDVVRMKNAGPPGPALISP